MNTLRARFLLLSTVVLLSGCWHDPNFRKQRYVNSGNKYLQQERYREAAIQYQNAIQIDKYYADAHYGLAQSFLRQGIWSVAYQELRATIELQPDNNRARIDLGNLLLGAKQFKEAQSYAESVLDRDRKNVDAHVLLANADAALSNIEDSLHEMQTAIQLAPYEPGSYIDLAYLQLSAKQAEAAEQNFRKAVSLSPKSVTARLALGNFLQAQKRWAEAEEQFRIAVQAEPKNPAPYALLGSLLFNQHKRADAEQLLTQAKQVMSDVPDGYRLLGDFYFALNDLPRARDEYASLSKAHPKDQRILKNYIQLLIMTDDLDTATKLNNAVLKSHADDPDCLALRGQILNAQGRSAEAKQSLEAALKVNPEDPATHYALGISYLNTQDTEHAAAEFQTAVRLRPNMTEAYRSLERLAAQKGDVDLLRQTADALISAQPFLPDGYLMRASANASAGKIADAAADARKVIAMVPEDSRGYAALAHLDLLERKSDEADKLFEEALARNPRDLQALSGLVQLRMIDKHPAEAAARIQQQIDKVPDDPDLYVLLGQVQIEAKNYPAAEQSLGKAVDVNPDGIEALLLLASVQQARGSTDQAIESYRHLIERNSRDVRPYLMLASLLESQSKWKEATDYYQKALQIQPEDAAAANNVAYLLLEHGSGNDVDIALSLAQTARRASPNVPNSADTLGWAYVFKGAYGLAIPLLTEAIKASPDNSSYHYHLGVAYYKSRDDARARDQLKRALELNPPQPQAVAIRKLLADITY